MNKNSNTVSIGNVILSSLFSGLIATLICFVFEIWYRMDTHYGPTTFINVASIIFGVNLLLLAAGTFYFCFKIWFKKGDLLYIVIFSLGILFCIWKITGIQRFNDLKLNNEFIQLLEGIVIITGLAALFIPYFHNNRKINNFFYEATI